MSNKGLKNFDLDALENRNLFQPIPSVPINSSTSKRIQDIWPRRGSPMAETIEKLWAMDGRFPWQNTFAVMQTNKAYLVMNCFTGYYIGSIFRKALGLQKFALSNFNVLVPSVFGSFVCDVYYHAREVTTPMAQGPRANHEFLICKSIGVHVLLSVAYQTIFTSISSVYFANKLNTHPLPDNFFHVKKSREYVLDNVIRRIFMKNKSKFMRMTLLNAVFATVWTSLESDQIKQMYESVINM